MVSTGSLVFISLAFDAGFWVQALGGAHHQSPATLFILSPERVLH